MVSGAYMSFYGRELTWGIVIEVKDAETVFDIDEFDDLTSTQRPTLYMKMAEIFSIHRLVAQRIDVMSPSKEDQLRDIIRELGSVKTNENELRTVSNTEITLYLNPRFQKVEGNTYRRPKTYRILELIHVRVFRPRERTQRANGRNQTLHPLHNPHPNRPQPNGDPRQARPA